MLMLISSSATQCSSSSTKLMVAACIPKYNCLLWRLCLVHLRVSSRRQP